MCTLIALHRRVPGAPLVVAANRDEFFDRPAEGPALRPTSYGAILAPRDVRAGGTWIGVNASEVFAAVTNRRCAEPDPSRRSRGLLVVDTLAAASAAEAAEKIESLPTGAYNPFNLLVADREEAWILTYDESPKLARLEPGVHVIGNVDPTGAPPPKLERLAGEARRAADASDVLAALGDACRGHQDAGDPLAAPCVHTPLYGTRSSLLLRLGSPGHEGALHFAGGPPCETDYVDFTPLLGELGHRARLATGESSVRKVS